MKPDIRKEAGSWHWAPGMELREAGAEPVLLWGLRYLDGNAETLERART